MIIKTQEDVTPVVVDAYKSIGDARLREIVASLVKHLHAFARDVHLTEEEFQAGTQIIAKMGQMTNATHNEVVLMSGSLGFSALVCLLNNGNNGQTETTANLLGPFWRLNSPRTENGGSIIRSPTPGPALFVNCTVKDLEGYPIPIDGPVGDLLRAAHRHNYRPAHLHFLILKEGFKTLISQIYVPDDPKLETDAQFGVTRALIGDYVRHDGPTPAGEPGEWYSLDQAFVMEAGKSRLPKAPIQ